MKPFNLEEAIAGKPLITRGGKKVLKFHFFDEEFDECIVAVIEGCKGLNIFYRNGRFFKDEEDINDLCMSEPEMWVNIFYSKEENICWAGSFYQSESEARFNGLNRRHYQQTIKIQS